MLKLYRRFKPLEIALIFVIIGITVFQVWCSMQLVDYLQYTVADISSPTGVDTNGVWRDGGLMIMYSALVMLAQVIIAFIAPLIGSRLTYRIRKEYNNKVLHFSQYEIKKFSVSSLSTRVSNDLQQFQFTTILVLRMFFAAPITSIWSICKINVNGVWQLTTITAIGIVAITVGLGVLIFVAIPQFKKIQKFLDKINGLTGENITGVRVIRAFNAEDFQEDKFEGTNKNLTKANLIAGRLTSVLSPYISLVMSMMSLLIYWIGAQIIHNGNAVLNYAGLMAYSQLSAMIVMSFMMLLFMFMMIPRANVCANRVNEVLTTELSIKECEIEEQTTSNGEVEFIDVDFTYPEASSPVVSNLNFKITQGKTLAIIGSTGSGKSSIINLIERFYDVTSGEVKVDGVNVKNLKIATLRSKVALVPQKSILFSGTVKENIDILELGLTDEEIYEALDMACASSFIKEKEGELEFKVAQGGTNFSGGQKQRLAIARAIASRAEIIVFDDSFSALDFQTDRKIRDNLKNKLHSTTKIIVAQRVGTIMDADLIIVLEEGKVVGQGSHKELLENCQTYKEIALSQLSKEELGL